MSESVQLFRPARRLRRDIAGQPCVVCKLRLHFNDVVALDTQPTNLYGHLPCFEMIRDEAAERMVETEATDDGQQTLFDATIVSDEVFGELMRDAS